MRYPVLALAAASLGVSGVYCPVEPMEPQPNRRPVRRFVSAAGGSIALGNRHTGLPHEHKREIARRLRQHRALADRLTASAA
jgi:hypothetical protein